MFLMAIAAVHAHVCTPEPSLGLSNLFVQTSKPDSTAVEQGYLNISTGPLFNPMACPE